MAEKLENVLCQLLVPDNAAIQQATQELKVLVKDPAIIPALCSVLTTSQNPQVRQYSAVLLRRRVLKARHWNSLPPDISLNIKQNLLQVLLREPEKSVRKSLAQLVATVAKHELPANGWNDLLQFLQEFTRSQDAQQREIGVYVLSTVASSAAEQLKPHYLSLLELSSTILEDRETSLVPFYAVQTLTSLVPYVGTDEVKAFQLIIPKILQVIQALIGVDEDNATEALEIFDELLECEVSIVVPHIRTLVEFCMQLGGNKDLGSNLRVKALSVICTLIRLKRKILLKMKLVVPLLEVLFPIMCEEVSEEEEDEEFEEVEASTAPSYACQVLDTLALHLPPEKFIPHLMKPIEAALQHADQHHRKAAYMAMAMTAEGCADYVRNKLLQDLLKQVYQGLQDQSPVVRNAALFALGQFSEHLQPNISKYSSELLPILFNCLSKASQDVDKDPRGVTKTFYAVETFCENLEKDILPYLPQLMEYLLTTIATTQSYRAKELAISAIGATTNAAQEEIAPYFPKILELLKGFLTPTDEEGPLKVQTQSLDTLGVLARTLGESFRPLAGECLQMGLTLLTDATDPDLRRCIYGLFAALSTILKAEMAPQLPTIVKQMTEAIKSTEGITAQVNEEEAQLFRVFAEDEEDIEDGEDDDEEIQGLSVENSYLDEKADACSSLGELAVNTGLPFMAHMEDCYKDVSELLEYPAADIRKMAVSGVGQFCIAVANVAKETNAADAQTAMYTMLSTTIPKFLTMVREDSDRQVAMATLDAINEMVQKIGEPLVHCTGMPEKILSTVKEVLQEKVACQDATDEHEPDLEDDKDLAEYDGIVIENAAEILPSMAKVLGGEKFKPHLAGFLADLLKRLKPSRHTSEQSFAVGTLAECLEAIGPTTGAFVQHLYPVFTNLLKHDDNEVRSNSVYAVGVLAANGGENVYGLYPAILKELFGLLNKEADPRAKDNICAAVCRMIEANLALVPLQQVLPVIVQCLPLKEDMEENKTVYTCIANLYRSKNQQLMPHLPQIIHVFAQVLGTSQLQPDMQTLLVDLVRDVNKVQPEVLQQLANSMSADLVQKLHSCLTVCNGS